MSAAGNERNPVHVYDAEGAWLATANYFGYLVGACACFVRSPSPGAAARWGLAFVVLFKVFSSVERFLLRNAPELAQTIPFRRSSVEFNGIS